MLPISARPRPNVRGNAMSLLSRDMSIEVSIIGVVSNGEMQ
jgi:hypothetical protein